MDYRLESLRYQLQEDPTSRVFFQLGELLRKEGQLEEAVQILESGLAHHPRYVAAWVSLGRARHELGAHERAEAAFAHALEIDPENQVAARLIGEAAIARGDLVRAVKALKLARALSPRDPELDERIAGVEAQLADQGLLHAPPERLPPSPPAAPAIEEVSEIEDVVFLDTDAAAVELPAPEPDWSTRPNLEPEDAAATEDLGEPFGELEEGAPETPPSEGFPDIPTARPATPPPVVVAVSADDPFTVEPSGDTGVWIVSDDVFGGLPDAHGPAPGEPETTEEEEALEPPFGEAPPRPELETPPSPEPAQPPPAFEDEPFGDGGLPLEATNLDPAEAEPFSVDGEPSPVDPPSAATTQRLLLSELPIPEVPADVSDARAPAMDSLEDEDEALLAETIRIEPGMYTAAAAPFDALGPGPTAEEVTTEAEVFPAEDETTVLPPSAPDAISPPPADPEAAADDLAGGFAEPPDDPEVAWTPPAPEAELEPPLGGDVAAHVSEPSMVDEGDRGAPAFAGPPPLVFPDLRTVEDDEVEEEEPEPEEPLADEVPLPTLTLARLAMEQGDLELAMRTLESLLRHHPESTEAARLLAEVSARSQQAGSRAPREPRPTPPEARIEALQGWLEGIRLAAERRRR